MTTDMEDIADDLVNFYYDKKITDDTFKNKYCTDYIKITGGFKGNDITKVRKIAREIVKEKKVKKEIPTRAKNDPRQTS